jgi:hypothetical protein
MISRIQQYLITRYPLVWNTRLVWTIPTLLLLHLSFFLTGLLEPFSLNDLTTWNLLNVPLGVYLFSVLVSALFVTIWLVFYLRNNPFKLKFPLPRKKLTLELLIIFLHFFGSITFFKSYETGRVLNIRQFTQHINVEEEMLTTNLAFHLIPIKGYPYSSRNTCDSVAHRALKNLEDSTISYHYNLYITQPFVYLDEEMREKLKSGVWNPEEMDAMEEEELEGLIESVQEQDYYYSSNKMEAFNPYVVFSFLHYCYDELGTLDNSSFKDTPKKEMLEQLHLRRAKADRVNSWLRNGQKDSVMSAIESYFQLLRTYGYEYQFNSEVHARRLFSDTLFYVKEIINNNRPGILDTYVDFVPNQIETVFSNILRSRKSIAWSIEFLIIVLYIVMGFTILLFSFRITQLKTWFISLIGCGIVALVYSLIVAITNNTSALGYLLLVLFFGALSAFMVLSKMNKMVGGVVFLWFIYGFIALVPVAVDWMIEASAPQTEYSVTSSESVTVYEEVAEDHVYHPYRETLVIPAEEPSAEHLFLKRNQEMIVLLNIPFTLLFFMLFVIPMAYRWQSNPEE